MHSRDSGYYTEYRYRQKNSLIFIRVIHIHDHHVNKLQYQTLCHYPLFLSISSIVFYLCSVHTCMSSMADGESGKVRPAHAGRPTDFAPAKTFEWLFSQPFEKESTFVPSQQRVPRVQDDRPIFVDESTGECSQ